MRARAAGGISGLARRPDPLALAGALRSRCVAARRPAPGDRGSRGPGPLRPPARGARPARAALGIAPRRPRLASSASGSASPVLVRPNYVLGGRGMRLVRGQMSSRSRARRSWTSSSRVRSGSTSTASRRRRRLGRGHPRAWSRQRPPGGFRVRHAGALGLFRARRRDPGARPLSARKLGARLLNLQVALVGELFVLEANPRRGRALRRQGDLPPLVEHACRLLLGESLQRSTCRPAPSRRAWAKEAIFPSERFSGAADLGRRCGRRARSWQAAQACRRRMPERCEPPAARAEAAVSARQTRQWLKQNAPRSSVDRAAGFLTACAIRAQACRLTTSTRHGQAGFSSARVRSSNSVKSIGNEAGEFGRLERRSQFAILR